MTDENFIDHDVVSDASFTAIQIPLDTYYNVSEIQSIVLYNNSNSSTLLGSVIELYDGSDYSTILSSTDIIDVVLNVYRFDYASIFYYTNGYSDTDSSGQIINTNNCYTIEKEDDNIIGLQLINCKMGPTRFSDKVSIDGDVYMNNNLSVGGDVSMNSNLSVGGDVSMNSNLSVGGDVSMNSKLSVGGDVSMNSNLSVGGDVSMNSDVDIDGNLYVKGTITGLNVPPLNLPTPIIGYKQFYGATNPSVTGGLILQYNQVPANQTKSVFEWPETYTFKESSANGSKWKCEFDSDYFYAGNANDEIFSTIWYDINNTGWVNQGDRLQYFNAGVGGGTRSGVVFPTQISKPLNLSYNKGDTIKFIVNIKTTGDDMFYIRPQSATDVTKTKPTSNFVEILEDNVNSVTSSTNLSVNSLTAPTLTATGTTNNIDLQNNISAGSGIILTQVGTNTQISADNTDISNAIATNTTDIATNTTAISTNTSNIATNTINIATNTSNIATNTNDISDIQSDMSLNITDIATNTTAIATNTTAIATNTTAIATNTTAISLRTLTFAIAQIQLLLLQIQLILLQIQLPLQPNKIQLQIRVI